MGIEAGNIQSSRSQCEIAAFITGADWAALSDAIPEGVKAVDLYLAFLVGANTAKKILLAPDEKALSAVLSADEMEPALGALKSAVPMFEPATPKKAAIDLLVEKLDVALEFVRAFAETLVAVDLPNTQDVIVKTEDDIASEEESEGIDDTIEPGAVIGPVIVDPPEVQPADSSLLISEAHLIAMWRRSLFPIDGRGIIVFGLRGCLPLDPSGTDFAKSHKVTLQNIDYRKMRCTFGQWRPGKGFALFPGSTVPQAPLVEAALKKRGDGVNQLGRGRYRNYFPNWHKRREGKSGHWALIQDSDTTFQRTEDDMDYDAEDRWDVGRPGDNIHCAFNSHDGNIMNDPFSSAGCQVIAGSVIKGRRDSESGPWKKFITPFLPDNRQNGVEYVLFDAREMQQMILTKMAGKTVVLRMGSEGPLVKKLQMRLAQRLGMQMKLDGKFGAQTFRAIIEFQQRNFGRNADDGIVGPETAEKLGITLPLFDFDRAITGIPDPNLSTDTSSTAGGTTGDAQRGTFIRGATTRGTTTGQTLIQGTLLSRDMFEQFCPPPRSRSQRAIYDTYIDFFTSTACQEMLKRFRISDSNKRLAHFFAQAAHETGGFTLLRESLFYKTVGAVRNAWKVKSRSVTDDFIKSNLLENELALAKWAYNGRLGNREDGTDGFDYRGGGTFQTTGRGSYRDKGQLAGVDLEGDPSLIEKPEISMLAACAEWNSFGGNALADADKIKKISRAINRGDANSTTAANNEDDRIARFEKLRLLLR